MSNLDFKDQIKLLGERTLKLKDQIQTEEATKTAFIMPFLQCLGYDVFNPMEIVPEYISDIGTKKGEKVDYAIFREGRPVVLIEAKHWKQSLNLHNNQIIRYFTVSKSKFAILTNGIRYRFFTDLVEPNIMDEKPFLDFDLTEMKDQQVEELKKFHKSYFDIANIMSSASELKYTGEIKALFNKEIKEPSVDFIRYFASQVYSGRMTDKVVFQFSELVKKSVTQAISDIITDRLKSALEKENEQVQPTPPDEQLKEVVAEGSQSKIETTEEEVEAYHIVKSIVRQKVDASRIVSRDAQSYFSILLDDNNRKAICRFYLNSSKKYIGILDEMRKETKFELKSLDEIYNYSEQLCVTVETYVKLK